MLTELDTKEPYYNTQAIYQYMKNWIVFCGNEKESFKPIKIKMVMLFNPL